MHTTSQIGFFLFYTFFSFSQNMELTGVVIEELDESAALYQAGARAGDLLTHWERLPNAENPEGAKGQISNPFDWWLLEKTQAPRGTIILLGERKKEVLNIEVSIDYWEARVRPFMEMDALRKYNKGLNLIDKGHIEEIFDLWKDISPRNTLCWMLFTLGNELRNDFNRNDRKTAYNRALNLTKKDLEKVVILKDKSRFFEKEGDFDLAIENYREILRLLGKHESSMLGLALIYRKIGNTYRRSGHLSDAESYCLKALTIQKNHAPFSLAFADTQISLGNIKWQLGDLEKAEKHYKAALSILEEKAPHSLQISNSYHNLGTLRWSQGELEAGENLFEKALRIVQDKDPESLQFATILNNLGLISEDRGDLTKAEQRYLQSLITKQRNQANKHSIAISLINLGNIARIRGNYLEAEWRYQEALSIEVLRNSHSLLSAKLLASLGVIEELKGDFSKAKKHYLDALSIQQRDAPNSHDMARSLNNLGNVAKKLGNISEARKRYMEALSLKQKISPNSINVAITLSNLAELEMDRKNLTEAEQWQIQALAIKKKKAPHSIYLAQTLAELATIEHAKMNIMKAQSLFEQSLDVLDSQIELLGGTQLTQIGYFEEKTSYYYEYLDFLIEQQLFHQAYDIYERSRAKILRQMIAGRDLALSGDLPQNLNAELQRLAFLFERTQTDIVLYPDKEMKSLPELQRLRRKYDEVKRQIKNISPELAMLRFPEPINLSTIQTVLEPGTILLSYAVMEGQTFLFMVRNNTDLKAFTIPKGRIYFRNTIETWSELILDWEMGRHGYAIFEEVGLELAHALIEPVRAEVEAAERLVIIPDGPLWYLPFGALPIFREGLSRHYLIEDKPITTVVSASLYTELKQRPKRQINRIVAMGDAVYPTETRTSISRGHTPSFFAHAGLEARVRSMMRKTSTANLGRIPHTATEIQSITNLFGSAAQPYLREAANEANFKQIDRNVDVVHVAAHGIVDNNNPLDSALLLTINEDFQEGEESGVIFAWEIFEDVRLDADLVVLSACETGAGKISGGEGIIGLSRAFQFAGARSILSSLWKVEDQSTAVLMKQFYTYLKQGMPKAVALQQAQIDLIRGRVKVTEPAFFGLWEKERKLSHPFYWAGFQLIGPWD